MARRGTQRAWPLTVFLLKEGVPSDHTVVLAEDVKRLNIKGIGTLYVKVLPPHQPGWTPFFAGMIDSSSFMTASTSAILVTEAESRRFAITFGYGRSLLIPGTWEERFGLLVTLNSVDPAALRSVDKKRFDANVLQSRAQTSHAADISEFGIDIERDLLRAVTGTPLDESLGVRMTGADALSVSVRTTVSALQGLLSCYYIKSRATNYRDRFDWVDHIAEVSDRSVRESLDESLFSILQAGGGDNVFLCPPEIINWTGVAHFCYGDSKDAELHDDIHVTTLLSAFRDPRGIQLSTLKNKPVHCVGARAEQRIHTWTAYQCIQCEIEKDDYTYLLSGGRWYRIAMDYVADVNQSVRDVPQSTLDLPVYNDKDEAAYNRRVCDEAQGRYRLMDGPEHVIVHGGGRSKVEFCDIFTNAKQIVHVKRYRSSEGLSHLFSQGRVSCELLLTDAEFRRKLNEKLGPNHQVEGPERRPDPSQYEIVFAIISKSAKPIGVSLPFFSRVTLRHAVRQLGGFNFRVSLKRIST